MIDEEIINSFKKRYKSVHPLVFHRSLEKSETAVDLFDILESIPQHAFFWNDEEKKWEKTIDFLCISKAKKIIK